MLNDDYITPPGTLNEILDHPCNKGKETIELSIFNDHRYAFFFWNKWSRLIIDKPPCLVTLDWHQDLVFPDELEKKLLNELNLKSNREVALFSWEKLRTLNDTHVLAAAYLNLIGNIYVHCRNSWFESWKDESIIDKYGNEHFIKKFKDIESITNELINSNEEKVYFDIDLDFFTLNNPLNGVGKNFSYVSETKIKQMLSLEQPLISWVFERVKGITIAKEPKHTGGLLKSNRFLDIINKCWFNPSLFIYIPENWDKRTQWRDLKR